MQQDLSQTGEIDGFQLCSNTVVMDFEGASLLNSCSLLASAMGQGFIGKAASPQSSDQPVSVYVLSIHVQQHASAVHTRTPVSVNTVSLSYAWKLNMHSKLLVLFFLGTLRSNKIR